MQRSPTINVDSHPATSPHQGWRTLLLWNGIAAALVWAMVTLVSLTPQWRYVELVFYDLLNVLHPLDINDTPIVIVAIDEPSLADIARTWPWPRSMHAALLRQLEKAGAKAIVFDILFSEPSTPSEDAAFAAEIARSQKVVLAASRSRIREKLADIDVNILPLPLFTEAGASHADVRLPLDPDGFARRVPEVSDALWRQVIPLLNASAPDDASNKLIPYAGVSRTFSTVSYYQALSPDALLPADTFRDKLVLVGLSLEATPTINGQVPDRVATPFLRIEGSLLSGVEAQATIIEAARQNRLIAEASPLARFATFAVCAFLMFITAVRSRPKHSALVAGFLSISLAGTATATFALASLWLPVAAPIAGVWGAFLGHVGVAFVRERAQRRFIRRAFGMYVSDEIIDHMLQDPRRLVLGGERKEITFIFTDVSGFTAMTEKLPPQTTVAVLRDYFEGMTEIVFRHGGTLGQLLGDGMLLFFNAPLDQPDHARRAVACALDLDRFACAFSSAQQADGVPIGLTRIGINTGPVIVGNFGSSRRFLYTGVGDAINTAARLESANKYFGTHICVSATVATACPELTFRPIGAVQLKGKASPIDLFEPMPSETDALSLRSYGDAYAHLAEGNVDTARAALESLAAANPSDPLVGFHLQRLRQGERGVVVVLANK